MGGFVPKRKTYNLVFEDEDMHGLEVKMRGLSTGQWMDLVTKREAVEEDSADEKAVIDLLTLMADNLVSWNVTTEDGTPVPANLDGVREQDLAFNMAIIDAWQTAVTGVSAPLHEGSPNGGPSLEASIPMETLSDSPESYAAPA